VISNEVESLIEFEKAIQWQWSMGDPTGYMDVLAEDVTYFDPIAEYLVVGREALLEHWKRISGDPQITRQEYLNEVAHPNEKGDEVVLAYNFNTYQQDDNGEEKLFLSWNISIVFRKIDGKWLIVHGHWSSRQTMDLANVDASIRK
jgi:ketosteroid isomerase-like protein